MQNKMILPPSVIGIIGGGQLGMMLAHEAKRMGYKVITLDPVPDCPCAQVCDHQIVADFEDKHKALELAEKSQILTYEFENVPFRTVSFLEEKGFAVHPFSRVLKITQDRVKEKEFLRSIGVPTTEFKALQDCSDLKKHVSKLGLPAMIKTTRGGYDGKGQVFLKNPEDLSDTEEKMFSQKGAHKWIWESFVPFKKEISVICARDAQGNTSVFPVSENIHINSILHMTIAPARISAKAEKSAYRIASKVINALKAVGVIGVEMFLTEEDDVLVNEIAPRVHNSGHYSIQACLTSQFDQHIRMVCGLPHGSTRMLSAAAMINILGDDTAKEDSVLEGIEKALKLQGVTLHLYGKKSVRPGRKMGHITVLSNNREKAIETAKRAKELLYWSQ